MTKTSNKEQIIQSIVERGVQMSNKYDFQNTPDKTSLYMDIYSVADELNLQKFIGFDDVDFAHDFFGIVNHMDRSNYPGKLKDCFLPRCYKSEVLNELLE